MADFATFPESFLVAMDTSTSSGGDDWAKFDNMPSSSTKPDGDDGTGWADFSNFDDMESTSSK